MCMSLMTHCSRSSFHPHNQVGTGTTLPTHCTSHKWPNNISVSSAPDVRGPWTPPQLVVNPGTNPAPWPAWSKKSPTSQIMLAVEDNKIFTADQWNASTYDLVKTMPWNTSDYSDHWTEDPFLWRDKRGHWHILCHWIIDIAMHGVKYPPSRRAPVLPESDRKLDVQAAGGIQHDRPLHRRRHHRLLPARTTQAVLQR
ncbi:hypothetical protein PG996_000016 [Apiospora saccharicola]|uniref:Uncharacterized protein n=1 Tax=Apiospora saccharicola TaxID=335842 RepID=A0ABR1WCJ0_9PEZI